MNRRTHKTAKHAHAKQRAAEHFGINLTKDQIKSIIKQITTGKARFLDLEPNGRGTYLVMVGWQVMRIIFQHSDKTIITVMPNREESY